MRDTAGKWILIFIIYFIALATTLSIVNTFVDEYSLDAGNYTTTGGSTTLLNDEYCDGPRFDDNTDNNGLSASILQKKGYITDEVSCELYSGLTWSNSTSYLWGLYTSSASCEGTLNTTYYNNGVYNGSVYFGRVLDIPIHNLDLVNSSKQVCELLGFKWYSPEIQAELSIDGVGSIWETIKDVATLRLNFYTSSSLLNGLLTFLLIWLPIIGLIIAGYIMIR